MTTSRFSVAAPVAATGCRGQQTGEGFWGRARMKKHPTDYGATHQYRLVSQDGAA